jgi:hypothetical protein
MPAAYSITSFMTFIRLNQSTVSLVINDWNVIDLAPPTERVGCIKTNDGRKSFTVQPQKGIEHALGCYTHKESF